MTEGLSSTVAEDWSEHTTWVRRLLLGMVRDPHLAEDIAQDALAAGIAIPDAAPRQPRAWLRRVARNLLAKRVRGDANRSRRELLAIPDTPATPEEVAERVERQQLVAREVLALPEDAKNALLLHYYEGASIATIAERLGVPPRTIQTRLYRARKLLKDRLATRVENWAGALLPLCCSSGADLQADGAPVGAPAVSGASELVGRAPKLVGFAVAGLVIPIWMLSEFVWDDGFPGSESPVAVGAEDVRTHVDPPPAERHDPAPDGLSRKVVSEPGGVVQRETGTIGGRLVIAKPKEFGIGRANWAVRTRREGTDGAVDGPWTVAANASTFDHRPNSFERMMPRTGLWLPGQADGTHAYVRKDGNFRLHPMLSGRYDVLVERDALPVAIVRGVSIGPKGDVDFRLVPLDVSKHSRVMQLTVKSSLGKPLHVRPILVFSKRVYFRALRGAKGTFELRCPLGTAPDVVLTNGASRPQRIPWKDGPHTVVLRPKIDIYLRAARPVRVAKGVRMPYFLFAPADPVLGLPPGFFATRFDLRPLAQGKTIKVPAFTNRPHRLFQQTHPGLDKDQHLGGSFLHPVVGHIPVVEADQIIPTVISLPDSIRYPKGATGSCYVRLPSRVVDLDSLRDSAAKK